MPRYGRVSLLIFCKLFNAETFEINVLSQLSFEFSINQSENAKFPLLMVYFIYLTPPINENFESCGQRSFCLHVPERCKLWPKNRRRKPFHFPSDNKTLHQGEKKGIYVWKGMG